MEEAIVKLDDRWNVPPPLQLVSDQLLKGYSWERIVEERFKYGGPINLLLDDLYCVHAFSFDEAWLLRDLLDIKGIEYLKALYKIEIISRLRIRKLISMLIKYDFHQYLNNLRKRGVDMLGVFWGSTGRFEASESSDYEFLFIRRETDSTTTYLKRELNEKLTQISAQLNRDLANTPEFKGTHPCGTITDYGIKRAWNYMMKHKRPMLVAYLFGYRFFEDPIGLQYVLKGQCLRHFGLGEIISHRRKQLGMSKFRTLMNKPLEIPVDVSADTLKDCGMDTVQSVALMNLKEEAGHSLVDDVLRMRKKGILNDSQTLETISSVLEIYKARVKRDAGKETITTVPRKLAGFKLALELLDKVFNN
jgi:predicted nucleotidyltransferase